MRTWPIYRNGQPSRTAVLPLTEAVWGGRPLLPQADTVGVTMDVTSLLPVAEPPAPEQRVSHTQP